MAHMSMFPGNCEIVEIEEELNPGEHYRGKNYLTSELKREEKDSRSLASNSGNISSLEDDLNQLFEMFNRRVSAHGSSHPNQAGTPRRNPSKKPVKSGGSFSPGHGISDRVNLKQALRGLCLSQASEMAAMKRSSKSGPSEAGRISTRYRNVVEDSVSDHSQDDGRGGMLEISLVPEEATFNTFRNIYGKSPASDDCFSNCSSLTERGTGFTLMSNEKGFESNYYGNQVLRSDKHASVSSSSSPPVDDCSPDMGHSILTQKRTNMPSPKMKNQAANTDLLQQPLFLLQKEKHASPDSSPNLSNGKGSMEPACNDPAHGEVFSVGAPNLSKVDMGHKKENTCSSRQFDLLDKTKEHSKSSMTENRKCSASTDLLSQTPLTGPLQGEKHMPLQSSSDGYIPMEFARKMAEEKEMISVSTETGNEKVHPMHGDEHADICSPRHPDHGDRGLDSSSSSPAPNKLVNKETTGKPAKLEVKDTGLRAGKISSNTVSLTGSPKGKKGNKSTRNAQHLVKPLIKTKNLIRRKSKKKKINSNNSLKNVRSEFNNDLYSGPNSIVCPRCQCVVTDTWKESNQDSSVSQQESPLSQQESPQTHQESHVSHQEPPVLFQDSPISPFASLSPEISSGNVISDVSTLGPSPDSTNQETAVAESSSNSKLKYKGEFTQSSKDSPGECSSSTSISEESILSRPSFCDRPHMSKDVRWEAVRHVRFQHGTLGLRHFNLLKKLGCGDIGTVYLAELIGTTCLFAIKVMDNEFLSRRKKIVRAQTEKDILRMLDHPFLPTLYCQFTSDNLSCLVMEYCPGGDLHVLRQRQPGRCFTEQAARFYVAEVLLALEYLHMLGVIYRDLKPENILVREDGHIMLSDFDLSLRCAVSPTLLVSSSMSETSRKVSRPCVDSRCVQPLCIEPSFQLTCFTPRLLASSKSSKLRKMRSDVAAEMRPLLQLVAEPTAARSNSFVGTHEYLAPEIIKGDGHGSAVDWWTYGIFLYELLYGRTPFKGAGNEETLANVVLQSLKFPDSPLVSLQARDLISSLLAKEPDNRLGTERGAAEIKQHPFFEGLNWALIRCAVPPELPEYRSYGMPKVASLEKNNKYAEYSSGSGSAEHLEFEVF